MFEKRKILSLVLVLITVSFLLSSSYLLPTQAATTTSGTSLSIKKTAVTHFVRLTEWAISKDVSPQSIDLFRGDSVEAEYQVGVTKTVSNLYSVEVRELDNFD